MEWTMGTRYEGLWECNKRCGHGIYYYMDGSVYHGDWWVGCLGVCGGWIEARLDGKEKEKKGPACH
jgi:hypothetical protein